MAFGEQSDEVGLDSTQKAGSNGALKHDRPEDLSLADRLNVAFGHKCTSSIGSIGLLRCDHRS